MRGRGAAGEVSHKRSARHPDDLSNVRPDTSKFTVERMRLLARSVETCSYEHMSVLCVFQIRPLSVEKEFELECDGIIREPLRVHRLIEAIIAAGQIGQGLEA